MFRFLRTLKVSGYMYIHTQLGFEHVLEIPVFTLEEIPLLAPFFIYRYTAIRWISGRYNHR